MSDPLRGDHQRSSLKSAPPAFGGGQALATSGEIEFAPCHHHGTVGPMAGRHVAVHGGLHHREPGGRRRGRAATGPSSNLNEGYGKVLRYGAYQEDVQARLRRSARSWRRC
ncbi:MAG: DUF1116 domain-containing protein [Caldilineaceae bacterium]